MNETDLHYPPDTCPFCNIAAAYPLPASPLWSDRKEELRRCVPGDDEVEEGKTEPESFVILRSRDVVAFLDILPMTRGKSVRESCCEKVKGWLTEPWLRCTRWTGSWKSDKRNLNFKTDM
jgi:hypothetical protein